MQRWEQCRLYIWAVANKNGTERWLTRGQDGGAVDLPADFLNHWGAAGWELVAVAPVADVNTQWLYFKRPIAD